MTHRNLFSASIPIFLLLALVSNASAVWSSDNDNMKVYVEPATSVVVVYTTFKVNVNIADASDPGVYAYEFRLYYNNSLLKGIDVTFPEGHFLTPTRPGDIFILQPIINQSEGYIWVGACLLGDESACGNGTLVTITFKAEKIGSSNLTISYCYFFGPYSQEYTVTLYNGLVEVILPDFNSDGRVDGSDLDIIAQAFRSYPSHERWNPICDVNKDSKINILDIAVTAKSFGKTPSK